MGGTLRSRTRLSWQQRRQRQRQRWESRRRQPSKMPRERPVVVVLDRRRRRFSRRRLRRSSSLPLIQGFAALFCIPSRLPRCLRFSRVLCLSLIPSSLFFSHSCYTNTVLQYYTSDREYCIHTSMFFLRSTFVASLYFHGTRVASLQNE